MMQLTHQVFHRAKKTAIVAELIQKEYMPVDEVGEEVEATVFLENNLMNQL